MNPENLRDMANLLNEGALNYSVFLRCYSTPMTSEASSQQLVQAMLGVSAEVQHVQPVATEALLAEVEASLAYAGDSGAGPSQSIIQSERFKLLLSRLLTDTRVTSEMATKKEQFWLKEGHPAYPVFWDFAYLFTGSKEATVFIGSSSD
jgi:hypothetical protein